jgi:hypothetical protein
MLKTNFKRTIPYLLLIVVLGFLIFKALSSGDFKVFLEAAKWVFLNNARVKGNFFVSTSLNYLISRGMSVGFEVIPRSSYRSFSRPADFLSQAE